MFPETLHPYQPTTTTNLPPSSLLDPSSLWTPTSRLELLIPPASNLTYAGRLFRLGWIFLFLPLHLTLVLAHHLSPLPSLLPPPSWVPSASRTWTLPQRVLYPIAGRLVWALTGLGLFPDYGDWLEREVPPVTRLLMWLISFPGRIAMAVEEVEMGEVAGREGWVRGELVDPEGVVGLGKVAGFWVDGKEDRAAEKLGKFGRDGQGRRVAGGKVVMYIAGEWCAVFRRSLRTYRCRLPADPHTTLLALQGGGYVAGHPAEFGRGFAITREAPAPFFHVNVRKATAPSKAFPGPLLDALTGYVHLISLGYDRIILAGDSSGAALATSLALYLANTLAQSATPPPSLILPVAVLAFSPWADLTLATSTSPAATAHIDDILRPSMLATASNHYLSHLSTLPPALRAAQPRDSPARRLATHAFFSPALPTSLPAFERLAHAYSGERPLRWLVCSGGAELFAEEIRGLVFNLEQAGMAGEGAPGKGHAMEVTAVEFEDEVHCCYLIFPGVVSPAARRFWPMVDRFIEES